LLVFFFFFFLDIFWDGVRSCRLEVNKGKGEEGGGGGDKKENDKGKSSKSGRNDQVFL